jgi:hypothetical protein
MKPTGVDVSGARQFEGRTAEEAVARARAALGETSALRCWKTRRGGVGGFFAREVFVASLTPPPGSEPARGRASRTEPGKASVVAGDAPALGAGSTRSGASDDGAEPVESASALHQEFPEQSRGPEDLLAGLVEATSDQVSLRSVPIPADAFDQVLAEAQAALASDPEGGAASTPPTPPISLPQSAAMEQAAIRQHQPAESDNGKSEARPDRRGSATTSRRPKSPDRAEPATAKKASRPRPKAGREPPAARLATAGARTQRGRPARLPDLRPALRSLGVPAAYLPAGARPSLDQLASVMGTLPVPPALPTRTGSVVAVVGSEQNLERTVDLVATVLSLAPRDVLEFGRSPGAAPHRPADAMAAEGRRLFRQIGRRRASDRTSLVALHAGPGTPFPQEARQLLAQVSPDYVLAAVGAQCKRVDVEHWIGGLLTADALALWDLSGTRTPGELLGVLPIAFVDGEASSSLGWTLALARRAMDGGR